MSKRFRVVVADPPWSFSDHLTMSETKRGADANYDTLTIEDLKALPLPDVCAEDAILVIWVPSALLSEGLEVMSAWGFRQTQTFVWVKTKKSPLRDLQRDVVQAFKNVPQAARKGFAALVKNILTTFDLSKILGFGLGRMFRGTHELAIVGVRGKIYDHLKDHSQRTVCLHSSTKHSVKPDILQNRLEKMFPRTNRLELFARRDKKGWTCVGNECPSTMGEDIRQSLDRLK